jgi:hypothetical protein
VRVLGGMIVVYTALEAGIVFALRVRTLFWLLNLLAHNLCVSRRIDAVRPRLKPAYASSGS